MLLESPQGAGDCETVPPGIRSKIVDNSAFTEATYLELRQALFLGAVFAVFVIFLFMLDWRSTIITAIALQYLSLVRFYHLAAWVFAELDLNDFTVFGYRDVD